MIPDFTDILFPDIDMFGPLTDPIITALEPANLEILIDLPPVGTDPFILINDYLEYIDGSYWDFPWNPPGWDIVPYENAWDPSGFDGFGDPVADAQNHNPQNGHNSCAVVTQLNIFENITGVELSEEIVCELAEAYGWYDAASGTAPGDVGNILEALGIPVERCWDANLGDIIRALDAGDKVMVGIDGFEVWAPYRDLNTGLPVEQNGAGHAVWVTGVDFDPSNGSVKLILNDSGRTEGSMYPVDAADFMNAWEDTGCFMAVAKTGSIIVT